MADADYTNEKWLPVVGWEGIYEVSDYGRVRSLDRTVETGNGRRALRGRILRPGINRHGYLGVVLRRPGVKKSERVHRLVLTAHVGAPREGDEACHGNGNRQDNRLVNLRWDSRSANIRDNVRHGTHLNARKVECPSGHPYSAENTRHYTYPSGRSSRFCRKCEANRSASRRNIR